MKKLIIFLSILSLATACTKSNDMQVAQPAQDSYFSRIRYFNDGRTPATDTIWTLHLISPEMVDSFRRQDGYIYEDSRFYLDRGKFWTKAVF